MANLDLTPSSVLKGTGAVVDSGRLAGETLVAGDLVYLKTADSRYWKADANASLAAAAAKGICLNGAAAGQPISVQTSGAITLGAVLTVGETYITSDTPGKIAPIGDSTTGWYITILGTATSTTSLPLAPNASGVSK